MFGSATRLRKQTRGRGTRQAYPTPLRRWPGQLRRLAQDVYDAAFEAYGAFRGFDLYHEPNHIPAAWHGPVLTTIHDLSVLRHPEWHPPDRVQWYQRDFLAALPRTHHFITVSEFSRREMTDLLGIAPGRISVIYHGPREVFHPRPREEVQRWLAARGLPPEYLLFVGTIDPRKNIDGLLAAYAMLSAELRRRTPLLLAGMNTAPARPRPWSEPARRTGTIGTWTGTGTGTAGTCSRPLKEMIDARALSGSVGVLDYTADLDLAMLYNGARALVWPSFYEGFGLPPLEAMASGTPVISSHTTSLPEVVGDAGLLVDPREPRQIAEAVRSVLEDPALAESLAARGLARSRCFSWTRCAAEHAALYRRFAQG